MGLVTIYLEDEVEMKVRAAAKAMNLSPSKWIADAIEEKIANAWPSAVREAAGSWDDCPPLAEIRNVPASNMQREDL